MRKARLSRWLPALLALALAPALRADTLVLKSGEKIEGKIQAQTEQEVTIEYQATPTIKDVRTVPMAEVAEVKKDSPDEEVFAALQQFRLGSNSQPLAAYDAATRNFQAFITQFPTSRHLSEVAEKMKNFSEEKGRVEKGEVKLNGAWLDKETVERERQQIIGQVLLGQMQELARRSDLVGALNVFDQMEKSAPGVRVYPTAVAVAKQAVTALKVTVDRALPLQKQRKAESEEGLKMLSEPQRSETAAALKREEQQAEAAIEAATKNKVKWVPLLPRSEKSLTALATAATAEQRRLETLQIDRIAKSIDTSAAAAKAMAEGKTEVAAKGAQEAITLWAANEEAKRVGKAATEAQAVAAKVTPIPATPTPPPATPKPTPVATPAATPAPVVVEPEAPKGVMSSPLVRLVLGLVLVGVLVGYVLAKKKKEGAGDPPQG